MELLSKTISDFCQSQGFDKTYWIAYSGGLDSHVLLHLFAKIRLDYPLRLQAVYINHGLSPHAKKWAQHCEQVCADLDISFQEKIINAQPIVGQSPEEAARTGRYAVFSNLLAQDDILMTAHHQNDQAETLLLQLLRGAGTKGLAAMPRIKNFFAGWHARPLLDFSRDDLKVYAQKNQLHWIDDESNLNTDFSRNFIRHEVLPILEKRWPTVTKTLSRSADHCAQAQELIEQVIEHDLHAVQGSKLNTLSVKKLLNLSAVRQMQVLRAWLTQLNFPIPSTVKMQQIQQDMLHARGDKMPCFTWHQVELRRYRDDLFALKKSTKHDATKIYEWDMSHDLEIPQIGILKAAICSEPKQVTVRFRQVGEVCRIPGREHHHDLKKLFQEWGVPPWERDRVPLIFIGKELMAAVGYFLCAEWAQMFLFTL